jgi:hypothetical protein
VSIANAACLWMCPVSCEISALSMPAMTAAVASGISSWRAALNATDPIGTPSMSMPCALGSVLAVDALALSGKSARVRALSACHWLALPELECAAIQMEAPVNLLWDCGDGVWRGYGGCIIHDGSHYLGPSAPFLPQGIEERGASRGGA